MPTARKTDPRIPADIEASADYYTPGTYAALLSYYNDVSLEPDELADQFIPLTTASKNPMLFAVGILPPPVKVTGRLLDRSGSIAQLADGAEIPLAGPPEEPDDGPAGTGNPQRDLIVDIARNKAGLSFWETPEEFGNLLRHPGDKDAPGWSWDDYYANPKHSTCTLACAGIWRLGGLGAKAAPEIHNTYKPGYATNDLTEIAKRHGAWVDAREAARSGILPQPGDMVVVGGYAGGFGGTIEHGFTVTGIGPKKDIGGGEPGWSMQSVDGGQTSGWPKITQATKLLDKTIWKWKGGYAIGQVGIAWKGCQGWCNIDKLPWGGGDGGTAIGPDGRPAGWTPDESSIAAFEARQRAKTSGTTLNSTELGKDFMRAQAAQIQETQAALDKMRRTPPLRMLVNPSSFGVKGARIVNDGNWGRNGPIVEHWGEEQDTISAQGKVAAFYAADAMGGSGPGLTRTARNFSKSWQNFQSLYLLYKNNAGMYLTDHVAPGETKPKNLAMLGSIYLYYDHILYIGSFSGFTISEEETAPFTAEYTFEFVVRAAFALDREDLHDYGNPTLFKKREPSTSEALQMMSPEEQAKYNETQRQVQAAIADLRVKLAELQEQQAEQAERREQGGQGAT